MKKTYFVGDMLNNTGPAIVNKNYYPYLKDEMYFCFTNNKILRTIHYLVHILFVKNVIISGFSKLNSILLIIARLLNKNTYYLMHGFVKEEIKYQNIDCAEKKIKAEYKLLKNVDIIICVSKYFSEYLKKEYVEFNDKIIYLNNGIDIIINKTRIVHDKYTIISVGGGMRQKNNLKICKVIENAKLDVRFIVIGKKFEDGNKIKNYSFVEYYENLSHDEVFNKMCESDLYIQNSYFETFGLAVMEALECGCNLLISKNVGSLGIINNITENDIIENVDNEDELLNKIKYKILHNNCNLKYNKSKCSNSNQSNELIKILNINFLQRRIDDGN